MNKIIRSLLHTLVLVTMAACSAATGQKMPLSAADQQAIAAAPRVSAADTACQASASLAIVSESVALGLAKDWVGEAVFISGNYLLATPTRDVFTPRGEYVVTSLKCEAGHLAYGHSAKATVVANDPSDNVAVLKLNDGEAAGQPMPVAASPVQYGDYVGLLGRSGKLNSLVTTAPAFDGDDFTASSVSAKSYVETSLRNRGEYEPAAGATAHVAGDLVAAMNDLGQLTGIVVQYGTNNHDEPSVRIAPVSNLLGAIK